MVLVWSICFVECVVMGHFRRHHGILRGCGNRYDPVKVWLQGQVGEAYAGSASLRSVAVDCPRFPPN